MARRAVVVSVTDENGRPARLDDIRWQFKLNNFVSELKQHSPVGDHAHDQGIDFTNDMTADGRHLPRIAGEQGSLKRHWKLGNPGVRTYKVNGKVKGILVDSTLPYSRIVDEGGMVGPASKGMHWRSDGGQEIITDHRRGYLIQGHDYIQKAADAFFDGLANCQVEWA